MTPAHERLMAELVAVMAANSRTPLLEIPVTVGAADLDSELGRLRAMETGGDARHLGEDDLTEQGEK